MKHIIFPLLLLVTNFTHALTKEDVMSVWKSTHIAFYEELIKKNEHIKTIWTDTVDDKLVAVSKGLPREIKISNRLLEFENLRKVDLYNIFCHELGHLLGGPPYLMEYPGDLRTISVEGQADYFAAKRCMGRLLPGTQVNEIYQEISEDDRIGLRVRGCETRRCQVIAHLSKRSLELFTGEYVSILENDHHVVQRTYPYQNSAQCRLDTFIAGAVSSSERNYYLAFTNYFNQFSNGQRPQCWFHPVDILSI